MNDVFDIDQRVARFLFFFEEFVNTLAENADLGGGGSMTVCMDISETYGTNTIAGNEVNGVVNNQSLDVVFDEGGVFFIGIVLSETPV